MANLYGVANPNPFPMAASPTGNVNCPAGTETQILQGAPPLPTVNGWYYPIAIGTLGVQLPATPPTFINWALRLNGGSDIIVSNTLGSILVASVSIQFPLFLLGYNVTVQNPSGLWNFQVTASPGANSFTVNQIGGFMYFQWVRAPDQ